MSRHDATIFEWGLLVLSMTLGALVIFLPMWAWWLLNPAGPEGYGFAGLITITGFAATVVVTAVAGLLYLPYRPHILRPTWPYLRPGYLFVVLPGLPLCALSFIGGGGLLNYLEIASWAYEIVAAIGALIFVALLRRFGLFAVEDWPAGKGPRAKAASTR
jgi:hypothetical protein